MGLEPRKLRSQLLTWLLVPLFILLVVDSFVSYWVATEASQRAYDRALVEIARELSLHLTGNGERLSLDLTPEAREILLADADERLHYELAFADGRHVEGTALPAARAHQYSGNVAFHDAVVEGRPSRVAELRLEADRATARPAALLRVAESAGRRQGLARELLLSVIVPQAVLIVVAGSVVWVGVVHGLSPLERLRRAIVARSHRDWSPVASDDVPAEVRPLLEAINELVGRLDRALTLQHRFIADAAHQLKTPVAALKAQLDLAMRERNPEQVRAALANAEAGIARLSRVVSQLLTLARNEPEAARAVALVPMDLNALVLDVAQSWVPAALEKRIDLGFEEAPGPVPIRGDAARLRDLLDNLLDNAVRYTPAAGRVTVRVRGEPSPCVDVSDDGQRIPADERERVFERFHRVLGNVESGSGLGLAIAQEIAHLHGGAIDLRDDADGVGNCFRVTFPRA